ncbi:hypothetical protein ACLMJK_003914 [Lecanora helva]
MPIGSLKHWSFHTQGIFYHLSAPDLPRESDRTKLKSGKSRHVECRLECEDFSSVTTNDYIRARHSAIRKVLLAYKVGQTDYDIQQIRRLAEWIISQLSSYALFSANCQHFVTTMVCRTVMRFGDRSAFAGSSVQIADWDLQRGDFPHTNDCEHGFVVAPPLPGTFLSFKAFVIGSYGFLAVSSERQPSASPDHTLQHLPWWYVIIVRMHLRQQFDKSQYVDTYSPQKSELFMRKGQMPVVLGTLLDTGDKDIKHSQ